MYPDYREEQGEQGEQEPFSIEISIRSAYGTAVWGSVPTVPFAVGDQIEIEVENYRIAATIARRVWTSPTAVTLHVK